MNSTRYYKIVAILPFVAVLNCAQIRVIAQGTFQNLNFESASPVIIPSSPYYPYGVTAASAFPDWTVTIGGVQQTQVTYDDPSAGATWVSLAGSGYGAIDGNYSALLQGGISASSASISQTGLIPSGTQSLYFEAQPSAGVFKVLIGSQVVPYEALGTGPNYTLYAADISEWAGLTEPLTFSALENQNSYWILDDISFSTTGVPEPDPLILSGIGGALLAFYRRFAPKRK